MITNKRTALLIFVCTIAMSTVRGQYDGAGSGTAGSLSGGHNYHNSMLGLSLSLPGTWQLFDKTTQRKLGINSNQASSSPGCQGPLCGEPEINVSLITKPEPSNVSTILLSAYKLSPSYLDRTHYPLRNFAETMTMGSLSGSGLSPIGGLQVVQLDGKPSYRLLVGRSGEDVCTGFGYVGESHGYVFLLVGSVSSDTEAPKLRSAIESMKFDHGSH